MHAQRGLKQTHKNKQTTHKNKRQTQTNGKYKIRQIITKTMEHTHTHTHTHMISFLLKKLNSQL